MKQLTEKLANDIVQSAFKTIFPNKDYQSEKIKQCQKQREKEKNFRNQTSEECFKKMVEVIFYSGMGAKIVTKRMESTLAALGNFNEVLKLDENDYEDFFNQKNIIKNEKKIKACIHNAKVMKNIDAKYGSFINYLNTFSDKLPNDNEAIEKILDDLRAKFKFIGPRTGRHFLMMLGLPTVKPDRMVMRVLHRLGLIDSEKDIKKAVEICSEIAKLTDIPQSFLDLLLVKIGQSEGVELCTLNNPKCNLCGLEPYCEYSKMLS